MKKKSIKVFISYSWDNDEHEYWVINLANKLREKGIDVILDKYEIRLGNDLNHFMEKSVTKSDRVLMIFTPNYKLKAEKRRGGVGYEYSIITSQFIKNRTTNTKFLPILKAGTNSKSVPVNFESHLLLNMTSDLNFDENLDYLIREIYKRPKLKKPNLGSKPNFESFIISDELICLDRKVLLKIEDKSGDKALCYDDMKFHVLKDREYHEDVFSSDSSFVEEIKTSPGLIIESRNENGKFIVKTKLDRKYEKGEVLNYKSSCRYLKCHSEETSYFSVWSEYKMEKLEITVCFPMDRKYKSHNGFKKSTVMDRKRIIADSLVEEVVYLGSPALRLYVENLDIQDKFSLEWSW
ncbi:TIR domain-containing protein [bacterium]|nr:MAG: TIR domain-containing protein [bacterium]